LNENEDLSIVKQNSKTFFSLSGGNALAYSLQTIQLNHLIAG